MFKDTNLNAKRDTNTIEYTEPEFDLIEYMGDLCVSKEKSTDGEYEIYSDARNIVKMVQVIYDNAYTARAVLWGMASGAENQANYVGGRLIPSAQRRLAAMQHTVTGEADIVTRWHANEDQPHVNDDRPLDQLVDDQQSRLSQYARDLMVSAITFGVFKHAHDEIAVEQGSYTYDQIKERASLNKRLNANRR